jgi:hypothetical protein
MAVSGARGTTARTARRIALAAFLLYAATGGGRIVGSDEVAMLELSRSLLRGDIAVPEGATLRGPDGRAYTKNAAGQAVLALPLVAAAEAGAAFFEPSSQHRSLAVRFAVSFFNAAVAALLLGVFYSAARGLGAGVRAALAATLLLGLTTPLWVYAKSFMAEPLQALGLLLVLDGSGRARAARETWSGDPRGPLLAGLGVLLAVSVKLSMLPFALLALLLLLPWRASCWGWPLAALALALLGHGGYNMARFGTAFETGYGAQATPAAYRTPLLVGLYGLLLSSGKGIAWFAPALWLAPAGWRPMRDAGETPRRVAVTVLLLAIAALLLYGRFEHWAGDGSWGPRYLLPFLPPAFLMLAFALDRASRARRALAILLGTAGLLVQVGGVAIHFGAQMREAGDYPYTLPLDDPRFMSDSHFNPAFSPIAGHWRLLARNVGEHLRGQRPRLEALGGQGRIGVGEEDQRRLLHALDFWWLYARYAGLPAVPLFAALVALLLAAALAAQAARAAAQAEEQIAPAAAPGHPALLEASGT